MFEVLMTAPLNLQPNVPMFMAMSREAKRKVDQMIAEIEKPDYYQGMPEYARQRMAMVFNEWARQYAEDPASFAEILDADGKPITDYGDNCVAFYCKVASQLEAKGLLPQPPRPATSTVLETKVTLRTVDQGLPLGSHKGFWRGRQVEFFIGSRKYAGQSADYMDGECHCIVTIDGGCTAAACSEEEWDSHANSTETT